MSKLVPEMCAKMLQHLEHLRVYRAIQNKVPSEIVAPGLKAYAFVVADDEERSYLIDQVENRVYWLLTTMVKDILDPVPEPTSSVGADVPVPEPTSSVGGGDVVPKPNPNASLIGTAVIITLGWVVLALAANRPYEDYWMNEEQHDD